MTTKRKNSTKSKSVNPDNSEEKKKVKRASTKLKKKAGPESKEKSKKTKPKEKEVEVNSKVREIISKSAQKVTTDETAKKESKAFTLDDVRSILSAKSKVSKNENKENVKTEKVKKSLHPNLHQKLKK